MVQLTQERCVPRRAESPHVTDEEIAQLHPLVPDWQLLTEDGIRKVQRVFRFRDSG